MSKKRVKKALSQVQPIVNALEAYKAFDKREPGWLKVELEPAMA